MKQLLFFLAGLAIAAGVCAIVFTHSTRKLKEKFVDVELSTAQQSVQARLNGIEAEIGNRLSAFAQSTITDQIFALRLIAENNPTAPEVTSRASEFLSPMGFSILDITDSAGVIISSGSFVASAGNPVPQKLQKLSPAPAFIKDNVLGAELLTIQAKAPITIADSIKLHAIGGMTVDSNFLAMLSPRIGVTVLLKYDNVISGWPGIQSISDIKDNRITINGNKYPAAAIPISIIDETTPADLIVVMKNL